MTQKIDGKLIQQIFIQLVRVGEGTEDTRQLATRAEVGGDNWDLVTQLASKRLVVTDTNKATGEETVEVVHEALIREWDLLRGWMQDNREFRIWQDRLKVAINQWKATRNDDGALLRGALLEEAKNWHQKRLAELSSEQQVFIQLSLELRDREKKENETQQRQIARLAIVQTSAMYFGIAAVILIFLLNRQSIIAAFISANKKHLAQSHVLKNFYLPGVDLSEANLWKANLSQADLTEANLSGANLQSAYLYKTYMSGVNLQDADLSQANLSQANLFRGKLLRAKLNGANLVKTYMPEAYLSQADLSQANLSQADLTGGDLSGSKLNKANLVKTYIRQVRLQNADLSQANLSEADIDGSDLSGANFQGAKNLNPYQIKRAKNWDKAKYDEEFRKKLGLK